MDRLSIYLGNTKQRYMALRITGIKTITKTNKQKKTSILSKDSFSLSCIMSIDSVFNNNISTGSF